MAVQFTDNTVDWKEARQWFIDSGVIPPTHRVTKPDVTLIDFARSLRDGVFLCSLLNKLKPDSVEYTARPVMQHSYLHNINAFLTACKTHFNIRDNDLFADSELYDVDNFSKVMLALSKLSHTHEALSMGWKPFPSDENKEEYTEDSKDIYASLQDISAQTAVYANIQNLYDDSPPTDNYGYGDEKIYDSVIHHNIAMPKEEDDKRKWILQELYETEKSFVNVLESIAQDYCEALMEQPFCSQELKVMFSIAQKLLPCHRTLQDGFGKCTENSKLESDLSQYFFAAEEELLEYGIYAAHLPEAQEKAKSLQTRNDTCKIMSSCQDKNQQRFPLSDLLPVPIQRLLKYPLLVKDLEKSARKRGVSSQAHNLEKVLGLLEDIAKYINVVKGDYDTVKAIQELQANLADYKGPPLNQCGRYHLDGELKIKAPDPVKDTEPKSRWVFLFDKILLITRKHYRIGQGIRYSVKSYHEVHDMTVESIPSYKGRNHSFKIRIEGKGEYLAITKTDHLRFTWTEAIIRAREVICPKAGKKGRHQFELANFDFPRKCSYCQKLLHGSYFQGYICSVCNVASHTVCLANQTPCPAVRPPLPPQSIHPALVHQHSASATGPKPKKCIATQRYNAIGPRRDTFLSFDRGDEIDIINSSDNDWWEGVVVKTGARGLVSPNYLVRKTQLQSSPSVPGPGGDMPYPSDPSSPSTRRRGTTIADYNWYIGRKTRIDAEVALHRLRDGVFLIRESMDRPGEYAVALKWNGMPKHIKIMKNPQFDRFYVSDACDFGSIPELVEYYQKNTLGVSFPGVHTTLKYPYLDVVEGRIQMANSRHPSIPGEGGGGPATPRNPYPNGSVEGMWGEAICDFEGEQASHLSFHKHDRVKIISTSTGKLGWWYGDCNGKSGLFRSDHIFVKDMHR